MINFIFTYGNFYFVNLLPVKNTNHTNKNNNNCFVYKIMLLLELKL